jgi:hypothetical protein
MPIGIADKAQIVRIFSDYIDYPVALNAVKLLSYHSSFHFINFFIHLPPTSAGKNRCVFDGLNCPVTETFVKACG